MIINIMIIFYFILYFILFIMEVNAGYKSQIYIHTKFQKKSDIISCLTKPKFYFKYLDIVEAKNIVFNPNIKDLSSEVNFPQEISYYSIPKISFIPSKLTQIKINQIWNRNQDVFLGDIKTKYLELKITIEPILKENFYLLSLKGEIIKKSFLIPEKYLDKVLQELGDIFLKITN